MNFLFNSHSAHCVQNYSSSNPSLPSLIAVSKAFSNDWKLEWSDKQIMLKQVWATGRESCLWVGAIWKRGFKSANPPGGNWLEPVVNWSNLANCSGVKWDKAIQNHLLSLEESPDTIILCFLSSVKLYSLTPHSNNSSSFSSNMHLWKWNENVQSIYRDNKVA